MTLFRNPVYTAPARGIRPAVIARNEAIFNCLQPVRIKGEPYNTKTTSIPRGFKINKEDRFVPRDDSQFYVKRQSFLTLATSKGHGSIGRD